MIPFVYSFLKSTSHSILPYLWSANLSKSFSQLIVRQVIIFSQHIFQKVLPRGKVWIYPTSLISWYINLNKSLHLWDASRSLPRLIDFLKLTPRSQIMPPRSKNFSAPVIKRLYSRWYFKNLVASTDIEYIQHGPRSSD